MKNETSNGTADDERKDVAGAVARGGGCGRGERRGRSGSERLKRIGVEGERGGGLRRGVAVARNEFNGDDTSAFDRHGEGAGRDAEKKRELVLEICDRDVARGVCRSRNGEANARNSDLGGGRRSEGRS